MDRRAFLAASGTAGAAVTAGCLGLGDGDSAALTNTPTVVVRRYYAAADDAESQNEFLAEVRAIVHGESPLAELIATESLSQWQVARRATLERVALVAENLGTEEIANRSDFLREAIGDEPGRFAEENAVVEASLDLSALPQFDDETRIQPWFLATEDGEWKLVWN